MSDQAAGEVLIRQLCELTCQIMAMLRAEELPERELDRAIRARGGLVRQLEQYCRLEALPDGLGELRDLDVQLQQVLQEQVQSLQGDQVRHQQVRNLRAVYRSLEQRRQTPSALDRRS